MKSIINIEENKFVELIGKIPNVAVQGYDKERNVIYWNKASETIYGYTKEEAFGRKLEDLIIPSIIKDQVIAAHKNWCEKGIPIPSAEIPLVHKNGNTIYVYSSHVMLKEEGKSPEMFCIDVDLTKQVEKELELKNKDKILAHQSKMAALGEMLDNIAHQWRQPLSIISSVSGGIKLKNNFNELSKEYLNDSIDSIVDTTKYLSQTIDDFRDFIRGTHEKKVFNVYDNLKYSLKLLDGVIKKNEIKVIISTPLDDIEIFAYPNELVQVIINIVSNSKDALKENNIEDRYIFIDIKEEKNIVILNIKDNANGIKENILKKVFEPNFTTKKEKEGTGIGLYMSERLVKESMNGEIHASNVDYEYEGHTFRGALFSITFPNS
jgi:PAS domain S-box-containing protein